MESYSVECKWQENNLSIHSLFGEYKLFIKWFLSCLQLILKQTCHAYFDMIDMCMKNKAYVSPDLSKLKTWIYELKV